MANDDMMQTNIAAGEIVKLPRRSTSVTRKMGDKKGQGRVTNTVIEQAYRDGRKDERIAWMIRTNGEAFCEESGCTVAFGRSTDARSGLDYAHDKRRSQHQGYRPGKGGQNDAHFRLLCRKHHKEYDGSEVRFTKGDKHGEPGR